MTENLHRKDGHIFIYFSILIKMLQCTDHWAELMKSYVALKISYYILTAATGILKPINERNSLPAAMLRFIPPLGGSGPPLPIIL